MAAPKVKYSPQEEFNNKKEFSNKVQTRILQGIKEISTHTEKLKIENNTEKKIFFHVVNYYYRDLSAVVFNIRQIVIEIDDQVVSNLEDFITSLNKILLCIQDSLKSDVSQLKNLLNSLLTEVGFQAGKLLKIVEQDNLHEHKQKILDAQHDLLISTDGLNFYVQCSNLSLPELLRIDHDMIEKFRNILVKIIQKPGYEIHVDDFSHYMRYSVSQIHKHVEYLRKLQNTEKLQSELDHAVKAVEISSNEFVRGILEAVCDDNPIKKMLDTIDNCHQQFTAVGEEFENVLQSIPGGNNEKKEVDRLEEFHYYIFIFALTGLNDINKSIEDAVLNK